MGAFAGSTFLQALGWAVLNSLWQMAFLWIAYLFLAETLLSSSVQRNRAASALLLAGFGWFVFSFIWLLISPDHAPGLISRIRIDGNFSHVLTVALPLGSLFYLLFLFFPLRRFIKNYRYVQIIRSQGLQRPAVELKLFVNRISSQLNIRRTVQIYLSEFVTAPLTIGYLKPMVLLPVAALSHLTPSQVESILLHEISHIRRNDYLLNISFRLIQSILYFNPFTAAFARVIEREREKHCDEMVLQFEYEPHGYASALLTLETQIRNLPVLVLPAFSGPRQELLRRVEAILGRQPASSVTLPRAAGLVASIICLFGFLSVSLMTVPRNIPFYNNTILVSSESAAIYTSPDDRLPVTGQPDESDGGSDPIEDVTSVLAGNAGNAAMIVTEQQAIPTAEDEALPPGESSADDLQPGEQSATALSQVANREDMIPELSAMENKQVKEALDASFRVLGEIQWKDVEKQIAEAMTLTQKELARKAFLEKNSRIPWKDLESNLKIGYDQINWPKINENLTNGLIQLKLDSLQRVYDMALVELDVLRKEMEAKRAFRVSDAQLSLGQVRRQEQEIREAARKLRSVKGKKIVRI